MEVTFLIFALLSGGLFLSAFLFLMNITGVNNGANTWLGLFYFCLGCAFFQQLMEESGLANKFSLLVHLSELNRFALAPSLYLAICGFINRKIPLWQNLLHFTPVAFFVLHSVEFIIPNFIHPGSANPDVLPRIVVLLLGSLSRIQGVVYWVLSYSAILKHRKNIRLINSGIDEIDLKWIKHFLHGVLIMLIVWLSGKSLEILESITPIVYAVGVFYIVYFSLKQVAVYPFEAKEMEDVDHVLNENKNYERLTSAQLSILKEKVADLVATRKLYLNPELSLPELGREVGINIHDLSYILNQGFRKTFYQYINEMRVEEAKRLLLSGKGKQLDMMGIAYSAGFNSKTTFYTAFKKTIGQTPTDFVKSQTTDQMASLI